MPHPDTSKWHDFLRITAGAFLFLTTTTTPAADGSLLEHEFRRLASDEVVNLREAYAGKVLLIVNTASRCGNTPQYEGLEKLYREYAVDGLVVLGFPSNDFAGQEPGSEAKISKFCRLTYGVKFPMFEKITVKKGGAHKFYDALAAAAGTYPTWNFHKYLVGRDGRLIKAFDPHTPPEDARLVAEIKAALGG